MDNFVEIENTKLWSTSEGNGQAILFLSGGPGFEDYMGEISSLIPEGYFKIRFDPRGCGKSDKNGPYNVENSINDIEIIRRHYKVDNLVLIGHSAGANMLLAYSLKYPQNVAGVVYITGVGFHNDQGWKSELSQNRGLYPDPIPDYKLNMEVNESINLSWEKYLKKPKLWRLISDHSIPVFFIQGEKDVRPNWTARQLAELLPISKYYELENIGHFPWIEDAEKFKLYLNKGLNWILSKRS